MTVYYDTSYSYTVVKEPRQGTMAEWYENEWIDSRKYRDDGVRFAPRAWPLAYWFSVAKLFDAQLFGAGRLKRVA